MLARPSPNAGGHHDRTAPATEGSEPADASTPSVTPDADGTYDLKRKFREALERKRGAQAEAAEAARQSERVQGARHARTGAEPALLPAQERLSPEPGSAAEPGSRLRAYDSYGRRLRHDCPQAAATGSHCCATASVNIPALYEPPFWWVMTASRLAALIIATRQTSAAVWSSS